MNKLSGAEKMALLICKNMKEYEPIVLCGGVNKKIDSILIPKYDYNIAFGKIVYDFYKENTKNFNKEKTIILSNTIEISKINDFDIRKTEEVRKEFSIPKDKTIIGFIGRLDEQKGMIPFIEELIKYKDKFNDRKFLLVGNG